MTWGDIQFDSGASGGMGGTTLTADEQAALARLFAMTEQQGTGDTAYFRLRQNALEQAGGLSASRGAVLDNLEDMIFVPPNNAGTPEFNEAALSNGPDHTPFNTETIATLGQLPDMINESNQFTADALRLAPSGGGTSSGLPTIGYFRDDIQDADTGLPVPNIQVEIRDTSNNLAIIYSALGEDGTLTASNNPLVTTAQGQVQFYAVPGLYQLVIVSTGESRLIQVDGLYASP